MAANRFGGPGHYVLDEREAALWVSGALALLAIVVRVCELIDEYAAAWVSHTA